MIVLPVGTTGKIADVWLLDASGVGITGKVAATFPAPTWSREGANLDVAWPALVDLTALTDAWRAGGIKERGDGLYRLDLPDAIFTVFGLVTIRIAKASGVLEYPRISVGGDLRLLDADDKVNKTNTPWTVDSYAKGTATKIGSKRLLDVDAGNIISTAGIIGEAIE